MEHVDGELLVIKDGHYVGAMTLRSRGPFKPRTGVKIKQFEMMMRFGPAGPGGPYVPLSISSSVTGRAFLLASFDEEVVVNYSEYRLAGSQLESHGVSGG